MAVTPTGAIYKSLFFDGEDSRDYGVYITGEAVFNAPEREVELVSIPGRNGAFALDKGRFENIEVTYPAGIFADTEADFAEAMSDFRNLLCSKRGYVRLQDEYNPDEYRMAMFIAGLEAEPVRSDHGYGAEFTLTFNCKPQRWLTSGETAVSVDSGDTLTNPTRFESSPLLEILGYGNIDIGGQSIEVYDAALDEQILRKGIHYENKTSVRVAYYYMINQNLEALTEGDTIYLDGITVTERTTFTSVPPNYPNLSSVYAWETAETIPLTATKISNTVAQTSWKYKRLDFVYGTASTTPTYTTTLYYSFYDEDGIDFERGRNYTFYVSYDGDKTFVINISGESPFEIEGSGIAGTIVRSLDLPDIIGVPTLSNLTKYIDLDIGECYAYQGGEVISWNSSASLPSDLPTLAPGSNEITYDNTITELKVKPRWWKI